MLVGWWRAGARSAVVTRRILGVAAVLAGTSMLVAGTSAQAYTAPDPGGSETAAVSVPPPGGKYFGFHEPSWGAASLHGWSASQLVQVAHGAGANVMRMDLDWQTLEPKRDQWNEGAWLYFTDLYNALLAHGMTPLIGVGTSPPWARDPGLPQLCSSGRGCEYPPAVSQLGQWAQFVREVATRFPKAAAIEVWNEPNMQIFWKPTPQPERYAQLEAVAYSAVKSVHPGIPVIAGSLAPAQTVKKDGLGNITQMPMRQFLQSAYGAPSSLKNHADGISFHDVAQQLDYGKGSLFAKAFKDVREVTSAFGDDGIPLWITEDGLSTSGRNAVSPKNQADGLLRQYRRLMTMPDVKADIIHTLGNRVEFPATDANYGLGLISSFNPFSPKPAFCAFAGRVDTSSPFGGCPKIQDGGPPPPPPPPDHPHRLIRHECRAWYSVAPRWASTPSVLRKQLISACVPIVLAAKRDGRLAKIKRHAKHSCQRQHPLSATPGTRHRIRRHHRIVVTCEYTRIRRALGLSFHL